jgi:hypothetical protein
VACGKTPDQLEMTELAKTFTPRSLLLWWWLLQASCHPWFLQRNSTTVLLCNMFQVLTQSTFLPYRHFHPEIYSSLLHICSTFNVGTLKPRTVANLFVCLTWSGPTVSGYGWLTQETLNPKPNMSVCCWGGVSTVSFWLQQLSLTRN